MKSRHSHYQDLCKNMRYFVETFFIICSFVLPVCSDTSGMARATVAVIDLKAVASKSRAGQGIEQQVAEKNGQSRKELVDLEDKIKSMEANKLSGTDPRKIEELQLLLYDMVKERRFQISEAYKRAIEALEAIIKDAVSEIACEKKLDVVLVSDAGVFFGGNCEDITGEAIAKVDQKCEHIELIVKGETKDD